MVLVTNWLSPVPQFFLLGNACRRAAILSDQSISVAIDFSLKHLARITVMPVQLYPRSGMSLFRAITWMITDYPYFAASSSTNQSESNIGHWTITRGK